MVAALALLAAVQMVPEVRTARLDLTVRAARPVLRAQLDRAVARVVGPLVPVPTALQVQQERRVVVLQG
jgi:hypothetical protein